MLFLLFGSTFFAGCNLLQGPLLLFGRNRGVEVKAQFILTENPILILVDDDAERVSFPAARTFLVEELGQELIRNKAAQKIIPPQTLDGLRQQTAGFSKRGCREIGELAGAEQVLWIQVEDYHADPEFFDSVEAAYFRVTVKVIHALEKERRSRVRLWPVSGVGHPVMASLSGPEVARLKSKEAAARSLSAKLAAEIARLFYDHRVGGDESRK